MPDLDEQLSAGRQRMLDAIEQRPFEPITRRARVLRRRARAQAATAIAAAALVTAAAVLSRSPAPPPIAGASASPGAVYTADGITINGLPAMPADLPGSIVDVEFVDADRGGLLTAACAGGCQYTYATTIDGGRTWAVTPLPAGLGVGPPLLVAVGDRTVVVPTPTRLTQAAVDAQPATELPRTARLQLVEPGTCGGPVDAWVPRDDGATLVPLVHQPDLSVCWVSPVRADDGAWWVGGVKSGSPAVAVSRDGGRSWTTTSLGTTGAGARVAVLGRDVYATVVGLSDELLAVYHSSDGGATFTRVTHSGLPSKVGGDLVALLDGRLLVVNGDGMGGWYLSRDAGATWTHAAGLHPTERIARTAAGYVAYKMTKIYTAFSVDGSTWRKLNAT